MKKRLFAGALALLMIIGLLPVSSMLKKPVEAQAADPNKHVFLPYLGEGVTKVSDTNGIKVNTENGKVNGYFTVIAAKSTKIVSDSQTIDGVPCESYLDSNGKVSTSKAITFTTSKACSVKVYYKLQADTKNNTVKGNGISIYKMSNGKLDTTDSNCLVGSIKKPSDANPTSGSIDIGATDVETTYYIGDDNNKSYIYRIEVVEKSDNTSSYNYPVTIVDSKATQTETKTGVNNAGDEITLSATDKSANFRYWENSEGIIVSRSPEVNIPVYYGDTYTAVYKNNGAVVNYLTSYGQVLYTYTEDEYKALKNEPAGPVRYGYAFNGWSKNIGDDEVIVALEAKNSYDITPNYDSAQDTYEITINTEALGGSSVTKSYRVNEVVTATVSSDNFAYWKDETGKIVSYSPTYLFFANKKTTVTAFGGPAGKEDDAKAVITTVSSEKASDGSPVVIFEYNIPAGYHIDFAGVLAHKTLSGESLTVENGAYVIGDSDLSYTTYRYTLTSKAGVTWNVKPMLKYTYNGKTHTIYGDEITLK